jgi:hypothetical protein
LRTAPCPRDTGLKNGACRKGERGHLQNNIKIKPEQLKLSKTDPSTVAINSRLLIYKAEIGEAIYYAKLALRVDPYFQVLALNKLLEFLAFMNQPAVTSHP